MIKNNNYLCLDEGTEVGVHIRLTLSIKVSIRVDIAVMYNITHDMR